MLHESDASMSEGVWLGEYLDAVEVPVSKIEVSDEV